MFRIRAGPSKWGCAMRMKILTVFTALALFGAISPAVGDGYTFTTIDVPAAYSTLATGINNTGQIVGGYNATSTSAQQGFLYSGGTYTDVIVPGSFSGSAQDINDRGQIVGYYLDSRTGPAYGFVYSGGGYTTLTNPAGSSTTALGINDRDQIVGDYVAG